jgi:hypothetical protein
MVEYQDCATSRHWQLDCASELVAGRGAIVTEYFDVGCSRRRSWRRPPPSGRPVGRDRRSGFGTAGRPNDSAFLVRDVLEAARA